MIFKVTKTLHLYSVKKSKFHTVQWPSQNTNTESLGLQMSINLVFKIHKCIWEVIQEVITN